MRAFLRTSPRKLSQMTISADIHGLVRNNAMSREKAQRRRGSGG
jgi:hypothetical protein